jgi:Ca-activated chloride channel family protein
MNFASPQRLILILAPIALLIAYLIVLRMRQKYVVRFTSVDLLASVAPRRPGWQRHIAAGLLLLALLALVVGFAEPTHAVKVARQRARIIVVIDTSGSMRAADVSPTRLVAAQQAAQQFVSRLPAGIEVGLVSFSSNAKLAVPPTVDHNQTLAGIKALKPGGATATANGLQVALQAVTAGQQKSTSSKKSAEIVLLSDGAPTVGLGGQDPNTSVTQETTAAKQANVRIDTIAFGTSGGTVDMNGAPVSVGADPAAMQAIASATGGKTFSATSLGELTKVYETIRRIVGYDTKRGSLTVWFVGAALLAACAAAAAGLIWSQRML